MQYPDAVILVYARAPVEGRVNTRLIPALGAKGAAELHRELLDRRLRQLAEAALCDVVLMCVPDTEHGFFQHCRQQYGVELASQTGKDLGERMFNGVGVALEKYPYCILVGTDAPALDTERIQQSIAELKENTEVVFVPAEDGGYVLLGLSQPHAFLFDRISWGTERVMQQSREQLQQNNIAFSELSLCWDIDRPEDYRRYLRMKAQVEGPGIS